MVTPSGTSVPDVDGSPSPGPGARSRLASVPIAPLVFVPAVVVILWNSWRPAWSADETASVMVVRRTWPEVLRTVRFDGALEPYYLFLKLWSWPSTSHLWLRLPSVVAMAAAVTALAVLTTRVLGRPAGILAAVVMLAMPSTSRFGAEARPYAFGVLAVVLVVACWARDDLTRRRWRQAELAGLLVVAGLAHPYALAVAVVIVGTSAVAPRVAGRRELAVTARAAAVALVVLAPFLVYAARHSSGQPNPAPVTPGDLVTTAGRLPVGILSPPLAVEAAAAVMALGLAGLLLARRAGRDRRWFLTLAAGWSVLPPALLVALQMTTGSPGLVTRYWLFSLPALAVCAAVTLDALRRWRPAVVVGAVVVLVVVSLPSQVSARRVDGELGQGWSSFHTVLALPGLAGVPLLTASWNYHALVANDPALAARMPLVLDPDPAGRIVPQHVLVGSARFARLARADRLVVVLATGRGSSTAVPSTGEFFEFAPAFRVYRTAAVLCRYFGQALGVFASAPSALSAPAARRLAGQIVAVSPADVRCAAVPRAPT